MMLPPRRQEILQALSEGLSNREIGLRLGISEETVKTHMRKLLDTYAARNRTHLVAIFQKDFQR